MNEAAFTPGPALAGGVLIGVAVSLLLLATGRVAGITGIVAGLVRPVRGDVAWRVSFVLGLVAAGAAAAWLTPELLATSSTRSAVIMVVAGLLVGYGTRLGGGCTSGHGVCGVSRLSVRSLVATLAFMAAGIVTVAVVRFGFGGAL